MSARQELDAARPVLAHMDPSRGPDKAKADLIAVWSAVEAALRSLVGGSATGGQALIRDARARQLLTFDQANALVSFLAVREQLDRPDYQPTESDVNAARSAFLKLDAGLMTAAPAPPPPASPYAPSIPGSAAPSPAYATTTAPSPPPTTPQIVPPVPGMHPLMRKRRRWWIPILIGVVVVVALPVAFLLFWRGRGNGDALAQGIRAYQAGDRLNAASQFEVAARAMPDKAMPHVYLSRMAREVGNYAVANQELQLALRAEPGSLEGRREYGSLFLAQANYDQARVWYLNALKVNQNDQASLGWLGCAMIKLNRIDEGMRFLSRAGTGAWSACRNAALPLAPVPPLP